VFDHDHPTLLVKLDSEAPNFIDLNLSLLDVVEIRFYFQTQS
jgi:hypothetical protein